MKQCKQCLNNKILIDFRSNRSICRICESENARRYRLENPEKVRAGYKNYYLANQTKRKHSSKIYTQIHKLKRLATDANTKSKQKSTGEQITAFDLWKIAKKQKLICPITGDKLTVQNISVDHIIPLSKGGKNVAGNVQLVTWDANNMKSSHLQKDFLKLINKIYHHQIKTSTPEFNC